MEEGSFSVEAAVVVPVVIDLIFSVLFFGFYLRDIMLIETSARAMLMDISYHEAGGEMIIDKAEETGRLLGECLWWARLEAFIMYPEDNYIEYTISANIFGYKAVTQNRVFGEEEFNTKDKLWFWKSITEEAEELFFTGGSNDGG